MSAVKLDDQAIDAAMAKVMTNGWTLAPNRDAITKTFIFKNFSQAFGWMTRVAMVAEQLNHHPEWSNVYKTVEVTLSTHDVNGLSKLDFTMASKMDVAAG